MTSRWSGGVREVALLVGLFVGYELLRVLGRTEVESAVERGWSLVRWQRALGLPSEAQAQDLVLRHDAVVSAVNHYYVWVHFPATAIFLVWLWWRHRTHYPQLRRALVALTGLGLVLHALLPVAPPRLLPGSTFVDTMAVVGPSAYGNGAAEALANQYAAFPSLHVGWALVVAYGAVTASARRLRWLVALHPVVTLAVVVTTANHYWTDAVAAAALLGVAVAVPASARAACRRLSPRTDRPLPGCRVQRPATATAAQPAAPTWSRM